jgi:hypothetical protein
MPLFGKPRCLLYAKRPDCLIGLVLVLQHTHTHTRAQLDGIDRDDSASADVILTGDKRDKCVSAARAPSERWAHLLCAPGGLALESCRNACEHRPAMARTKEPSSRQSGRRMEEIVAASTHDNNSNSTDKRRHTPPVRSSCCRRAPAAHNSSGSSNYNFTATCCAPGARFANLLPAPSLVKSGVEGVEKEAEEETRFRLSLANSSAE